MKRLIVLLLIPLSVPVAAHAQQRDVSRYTRVLLPFHQSVRSGDGIWSVSWWIRNDGDVATDVFPVALGGGLPPPPEFRDFVSIPRYPAVRANATLKAVGGDVLPSAFFPAFIPLRTNRVGAFLYVEKTGQENLAIAGTLAWRSLGLQPSATPLRAIPEQMLLSGKHSIVAVPSVAGARYDLRIYALGESVTTPRVTVRVFDTQAAAFSPDDPLVQTATGNLEFPAAVLPPCFQPCDVPTSDLAPASLEILALFEPPGDPRFRGAQTFRIEIEPEPRNVRWWAVVSIMDQATRQVTVHQP